MDTLLDPFAWTLAVMRGAVVPPACVPGLTGKVYTVPVNSPDPIPRARVKRVMVTRADTSLPRALSQSQATVRHVIGEVFTMLAPFPLDARLARYRCACGHEMLLSRRRVEDGTARCPACAKAHA